MSRFVTRFDHFPLVFKRCVCGIMFFVATNTFTDNLMLFETMMLHTAVKPPNPCLLLPDAAILISRYL